MTHVSRRSESTESMFAIMANPDKIDLTRPRPVTSLEGLRFPGQQEGYATIPVEEMPRQASTPPPIHDYTLPSPLKSAARSILSSHNNETPKSRNRFDLGDGSPKSARRQFFRTPNQNDILSPLPSTTTRVHDDYDPYENMSKTEIEFEKQSTLMELDRLSKAPHHCTLSRHYTMLDSLADMKFEVRCHLTRLDESNTVKFMSDGMKLLCQGTEMLNNRWGPFLDLDGWAAAVTDDMSKYESSLGKLYRKYWKRSSMAPEMELGFGIVGSILLHHFKRKAAGAMFGGGASRGAAAHTSFAGGHEQGATPYAMPSANPRAPKPSFSVVPNTASVPDKNTEYKEDEEELPPDNDMMNELFVPESVPLSARKRLDFS
jgi:hypothetical protein